MICFYDSIERLATSVGQYGATNGVCVYDKMEPRMVLV